MTLIVAWLYGLACCTVWFERSLAAYLDDRSLPRWQDLIRSFWDGFRVLWRDRLPATAERDWQLRIGPIVYLALALFAFVAIPLGVAMPSPIDQSPPGLSVSSGMDVGLLTTLAAFMFSALFLVHFGADPREADRGGRRFANLLPLTLSLFAIVMLSGSARLESVMLGQATTGIWWCAVQPLAAAVFMCVAVDPTGEVSPQGVARDVRRGPPGELADYLHSIALAYLFVIVFLGGWHFWGLTPHVAATEVTGWGVLLRFIVLQAKVVLVILAVTWFRFSALRFTIHSLLYRLRNDSVLVGAINLGLVALISALPTERWGARGVLAVASWVLLAAWSMAAAQALRRR